MKTVFEAFRESLVGTVLLLFVLCGLYPLGVWGLSRLLFPEQSSGSLILSKNGTVLGSTLIGQGFQGDRYFTPRPSAAGSGYDATASGGSNLGPTSARLRDSVQARVRAYRIKNGLADSAKVPADAVLTSASGLDPEISPMNAALQVPRIARMRGLTPDQVEALIRQHTRKRDWGFLGEPGVNVLALNLALDGLD